MKWKILQTEETRVKTQLLPESWLASVMLFQSFVGTGTEQFYVNAAAGVFGDIILIAQGPSL